MQVELEVAIREVMATGNGAAVIVPSVGGESLRVSYLWGKLRIDKLFRGATIPLPARGVGGSDSTASNTP